MASRSTSDPPPALAGDDETALERTDSGAVPMGDVKIRPPKAYAGGWPAFLSALKHTAREMGVWQGTRTLLQVNQRDGFDCPGCAWPDPPRRATFEFCENGAKAVAHEATTRRVEPAFFERFSIPELLRQSDRWLEAQGRLTHPMVRRAGSDRYAPIAWPDAFRLVASHLHALRSPHEAIFYTSGRTSNEAAFLYQLLARRFGTNNLPDCSNMCHESSGMGMMAVLGVGKGTVTLDDFARADAIFVVGQNPGTNHPRMLATLEAAARRGCRIVSINPLREPGLVRFKHPKHVGGMLGRGTALAELFLQVRVNGDVALLKGLMKELLEEEARRPGHVLDHTFIERHTSGFQAFAAALEATPWELLVEQSGVTRDALRRAAEIYMEAEAVIACWAMGLTQHKNAVANVQELVNLLLLRGNIGRPGAGACPVRGHSNVQGDRTVGICEAPTPDFLDRLSAAFGFEPPRAPGYNTVAAIEAMHTGAVSVFVAMGGNFVMATPDTAYTSEAVSRCRLTVQIATKLNRSHLVTGEEALLLPCLARSETDLQGGVPQLVSVEGSMGIVQPSQGRLEPASEHLKSEPALVAGLAEALFATGDGAEPIPWSAMVADYDRIRDRIEATVPGFEDYNRRVREPAGITLPNGARERVFATPSGRAEFTVHPVPRHELAAGQWLMMTIRSHDQYNTTIYSDDDRYRGIYGQRRVVLMRADEMTECGLREGQLVDLVSHFEGEERVAPRFAAVPYDLPPRCVATYFPEANVLVPLHHKADISHTPASKSVVVSLRATSR
jgi:molybdopterin-dependent oxidoreductase alpha subunit